MPGSALPFWVRKEFYCYPLGLAPHQPLTIRAALRRYMKIEIVWDLCPASQSELSVRASVSRKTAGRRGGQSTTIQRLKAAARCARPSHAKMRGLPCLSPFELRFLSWQAAVKKGFDVGRKEFKICAASHSLG
jgi:hypothetical protein